MLAKLANRIAFSLDVRQIHLRFIAPRFSPPDFSYFLSNVGRDRALKKKQKKTTSIFKASVLEIGS